MKETARRLFWFLAIYVMSFAAFAAAFGLLAFEQLLLVWSGLPREEQTWFYLMRLVAFFLIIGAILRKNRRRA